jgi:nitroreductase
LEFGKLGAQAFHFLQSWRLVARLNRLGFSSLAAGRSGQLIRKSAAIGLVTVKEISTQAFVDGGRAFERLWLNATFQGLSFQPMTGFLFLQLRGILGDHEGLTQEQLELLASLREQLGLIFELGRSQVPAMMFRIGRSSSPTARTVRRSVAELFAG